MGQLYVGGIVTATTKARYFYWPEEYHLVL